MVYIPKSALSEDLSLAWLDRQGKIERLPAPPRPYREPHLSPDGRQIAVTLKGRSSDIWVYNIPRGTLTRVTFDGRASGPVWSPDGLRIAYSSFKNGQWAILWKLPDASAREETLVGPQNFQQFPVSFTPDAKSLAYMLSNPHGPLNINVVSVKGDRTPRTLVATEFEVSGGLFSPDGRWFVYFSVESGGSEMYVQPFQGPGGKWQVSTSGGFGAVWSHSGREIFYESGNQIFSVDVAAQPRFTSSRPHVVTHFTPALGANFLYNRQFDVAPDGRRFLVVAKAENTPSEEL